MEAKTTTAPGSVAILGSGETSAAGRRVLFDLLRRVPEPRTVAVLDSPAGFQPNHLRVAGKIADFIADSLGELRPQPRVIETRRAALETPAGTAARRAIAEARCVVAGPGSPTYMVRELAGTAYLAAFAQAHAAGAALYLASAASIALGVCSLPVYEIFKAGEVPRWVAGLDLFGPLGLRLAIVPHWNNTEGGDEVDTSHCFVGRERFECLLSALPPDVVTLGIDEHTACVLDFVAETARVAGKGCVHVLRGGQMAEYARGATFPLATLRADGDDLPAQGRVTAALAPEPVSMAVADPVADADDPPAEATADGEASAAAEGVPERLAEALVALRAELRGGRQFALADQLRAALAAEGVLIEDTPDGPRWRREPEQPS
jgi:cyanophycinase-like exopeptidase